MSESIDNSDDSEMMISDTSAGAMASGGTDNGSPVDEDGTGDADGGPEGGAESLSDGPLAAPIRNVIETSSDDPGGG